MQTIQQAESINIQFQYTAEAHLYKWMDVDGWMDGWMDGRRMDGWMDGWIDEWMDFDAHSTCIPYHVHTLQAHDPDVPFPFPFPFMLGKETPTKVMNNIWNTCVGENSD